MVESGPHPFQSRGVSLRWPVVILRDNNEWEVCQICSRPIPAPPNEATFEERVRHYKNVHQYREIPARAQTETVSGKTYKVVLMEHKCWWST